MELAMAASKAPISPFLSLPVQTLKPIPKPPLPLPPTQTPTNLEQTKVLHARLLRTHFHRDHQTSPSAQLNSLITLYIKNRAPGTAIRLYAHARNSDARLDTFTVPSVLKACSQLSSLRHGMEVHSFAVKSGLNWDVFVHNSLIQMYTECGSMELAIKVFDEMPDRDIVSWSTMIRGYSRCRSYGEAMGLVGEMLILGVRPSEVAVINMLNLFADVTDFRTGWPMHAYLIKNCGDELPGANATTSLIDFYAKSGRVDLARRVFDRIPERSTASWSAMIAGLVRSGNTKAGMQLLVRMRQEEVLPNEITMLSLVLECGVAGASGLGKLIHAYILRNGFELSHVLATAVVDMYCKCGEIASARALFDRMKERDIMCWTCMISGYALAGGLDQAFELFGQMKAAGVRPNEMTMVGLLSLCAESGALDRGRWVHACIDKLGIASDVVLATALIDMYVKCGNVDGAHMVFSGATEKDVCMWNAMLNGLAMNGLGGEAIELFYRMESEGINPNAVTLIGVLRACSHSGLVEQGRHLFHRMGHDFGLVPKIEHYGCMVDLFGRSGQLDDALEMINQMPIAPNVVVWGALVAACKVHKNPKLGEVAARELLRLEPDNIGYNVLLSNVYATGKRWNDVAAVRKTMKDTGIRKSPGVSSIEVNGSVHEFVMGECSHAQNDKIQEMLAEMQRELKKAGHVIDTSAALLNVDEEEKETSLTYHSEKLAMAFGLISTSQGTPLRIMKNLRVCDDCHAATKLLSKLYNRVIIVRDRNRFHRFSEGSCSCRDYW